MISQLPFGDSQTQMWNPEQLLRARSVLEAFWHKYCLVEPEGEFPENKKQDLQHMVAERSPSAREKRRGRFMTALFTTVRELSGLQIRETEQREPLKRRRKKSPAETYDPALASARAAVPGESRALWEVTGIQSPADARWSHGRFKSAHG